ncbi:MAG: cation:proton antiporter [Candidatus Diapherotrites archaeon]|nr:cation:proton antiporter [Candidatus Diapherotrites archaeon]
MSAEVQVLPLTLIGIIILIAIGLSILSKKIGLNPVLGYIIAGFILGPVWLNMLDPTNPATSALIHGFSELGLFILLFYLGLELSLKDFIKAGSSAIGIALVDMLFSVGLGLIIMTVLGFDFLFSVIVGMMLFSTSTAVVAKFALDKNLMDNHAAKLAIAILILQDFLGILLLVLITSMSSTQQSALSLGIAALVFAVATFFAVSHLSKLVEGWLKKNRFGHSIVTLYALGIGLVVATLADLLGLSITLGAYFAGFALAETQSGQKIKADVGFLRDFFLVFFFVAFGSTLFFNPVTGQMAIPAPNELLFLIGMCLALAIGAIIAHGAASHLFGGFFGLSRKDASLSSIMLVPLGEFVVIIATAAALVFSGTEATLLSPIAFLLILITVIIFQPLYNSRHLHERLFSLLPHPTKEPKKSALKHHTPYTLQQFEQIALHGFVILCFAWVAVLLYSELPDFGFPLPHSRLLIGIIIFLFFASYPGMKALSALRNIVRHGLH